MCSFWQLNYDLAFRDSLGACYQHGAPRPTPGLVKGSLNQYTGTLGIPPVMLIWKTQLMDVLPDQALDCPEALQHLLSRHCLLPGESVPRWALASSRHNQEADRLRSAHSVSFCGECHSCRASPSRSYRMWSNFCTSVKKGWRPHLGLAPGDI